MYALSQAGNAGRWSISSAERRVQITCLYDMDIPRPENFNETYLYEGELFSVCLRRTSGHGC